MEKSNIDGLIILDKPKGFTSNDCIAVIKKSLHPIKIGHTGTLDPNATGVLVCLLGKATRCQDFLMKSGNKIYLAELILGVATDTEDITGKINCTSDVSKITINNIENIVKTFIGDYDQIPPMYSAKKVDGKKLVDIARKGQNIIRNACRVNIKCISIDNIGLQELYLNEYYKNNDIKLSYKDTIFNNKIKVINLIVECSKGTYIRTLLKDIGVKLGINSCMGNLRRIATGEFDIKESIGLEDLKSKTESGDLTFIKPCLYQEHESVITFGKFETLHKGHQLIIEEVIRCAKESNLKSTVLIIGKNEDSFVLSSAQRISRLKYLGVDNILEFPLNESNMKMSKEDFINEIIIKQLKAKKVVVGSDCSFGYKGLGDTQFLKYICEKNGVEVKIFDKLKVKNSNVDISSTLVNKEYKQNNLDKVQELIDYSLRREK